MVSFVFVFSIRGKQSIFNKFDCKAFKLETKKMKAQTRKKYFLQAWNMKNKVLSLKKWNNNKF